MGRKQKQYHFIYKTRNIINEKYYIGMYSTDNLEDGYIGSGKYLRRSINKYGKENFKLEIIEFLSDRSLLIKREKELINEESLKDKMCMNLRNGGQGGYYNSEHYKKTSKMGGDIHANKLKHNKKYREEVIERLTISSRKNWININFREKILKNLGFKNKKHSEESKKLIGEKNSIKQKGENNSQYGTIWITNGIENKKIKKESEIPHSWFKGRTLNRK